jgi:hypothetical protein
MNAPSEEPCPDPKAVHDFVPAPKSASCATCDLPRAAETHTFVVQGGEDDQFPFATRPRIRAESLEAAHEWDDRMWNRT